MVLNSSSRLWAHTSRIPHSSLLAEIEDDRPAAAPGIGGPNRLTNELNSHSPAELFNGKYNEN